MSETATQLLHRLTSYSPELAWDQPQSDPRLVHGFTSNDMTRRPLSYKHYDLPRLSLPRDLPASTAPATSVVAGTAAVPTGSLDLRAVARLLYLSCGVTRTTERAGHRYLFRAAGSAGARFPLEAYLIVPDQAAGLPSGVHWYDPAEHALVQIAEHALGECPTFVVTGVPWRTGWRYRERGWRHIYWDAGTMLAQLLAVASSAGLDARLYTRFPDAEVATLVGADGVQEFPVAVVSLSSGSVSTPSLRPTSPVITGSFEPDAIEFPLVTSAQHAGDLIQLGHAWPLGAPVPTAAGGTGTLDEVVLRRGSTRLFAPTARLPLEMASAMLSAALRGIEVPHWLAASRVSGLPAGLYRWPALDRPTRAGDLRQELYAAALQQGLARDASFVVLSAVDLADLDDRGYREAQLAAGLVAGRLHLMAYALGVGASGMTFQDSALAALLGSEAAGLLWTCVGVPEYRSAPGGAPGRPTTVRMIAPRL
ncbi:MAG TPA: nitroreductase family protein [Jatrophihabitans sp.]|nr:nitroreductase family protein [Jatrophihabitans sp.]